MRLPRLETSGPKAGGVTLLQMGLGTSELKHKLQHGKSRQQGKPCGWNCREAVQSMPQDLHEKRFCKTNGERVRMAKAKLLLSWRRGMGRGGLLFCFPWWPCWNLGPSSQSQNELEPTASTQVVQDHGLCRTGCFPCTSSECLQLNSLPTGLLHRQRKAALQGKHP